MDVALVFLDVSGGRDLRIPNSVPYRGSQAGWLARLTTTTSYFGTKTYYVLRFENTYVVGFQLLKPFWSTPGIHYCISADDDYVNVMLVVAYQVAIMPVSHGGFGCTIRSVPYGRHRVGSWSAFARSSKFCNIGTVYNIAFDPAEIERMSVGLRSARS